MKIHAPHRQSGYIARTDYEQTVDSDGNPDWLMFYQPGPKARAEYRAFTKRGGPVTLEAEPLAADPPALAASQQAALPLAGPEPSPLEAALIGHGVTPAIAAALLREHGEETIRLQIDYLQFLPAKKREKIDDPAAYLVTAIRNGHAAPKGYVSAEERQRREEARQAKERDDAERQRREREQLARARAEKQAIAAYWDALTPEQQAAHDAAAIAQADAEERKLIEPGPMQRIGLGILRDKYIRHVLRHREQQPAEA